jgi:ankyrin repeat protein
VTIKTDISNTSTSIFYWRGVADSQNLLEDRIVAEKVTELLTNQCTNGSNLEKLKNYSIYSIRTSKKGRLLFSSYLKGGKNYLLLLEYLPNHEYGKSKFLKAGVLEKFCAKNHAVSEVDMQWEGVADGIDFDHSSFEGNFDYAPIDYFNSTFISFNDFQGNVLKESLPLLVSGPPGSGKSCVALSSVACYLSGELNRDNKSVVYVCLSENLANIMRGYWEQHPLYQSIGEAKVVFSSYEDLLKSLNPELETYSKITDEDIYNWLETKKIPDPKSILEEFRILSPYSKEEYLGLGRRQCLYQSSNDREGIWDLFQDYKEWLAENLKYDIRICDTGLQGVYDLLVVDEAQDLSPWALMQLYNLSKGGSISYFMDTQQDLEDSLSKRIHLKQLMYAKGIELNIKHLPTVYRCPHSVLNLANRWLGIKAFLVGGTADKEEYREIQLEGNEAKAEGLISWDVESFANVYSNIRRLHKETDIAIIVDESTINDRELSKRMSHQLFTPEEIKGLEYPVVILFKPFESSVFKEINKKLQDVSVADLQGNRNRSKSHSDQKSKSRLVPELSKIFTSITRSEDTLVLYQPIIYGVENIHRVLETALSQGFGASASNEGGSSSSSSSPVETTKDDWFCLAKKYYEKGLMKKFDEVCRNELDTEPDVIKLQMGDERANEATLENVTTQNEGGSSSSEGCVESVQSKQKLVKGKRKKRKGKRKNSNRSKASSKLEGVASHLTESDHNKPNIAVSSHLSHSDQIEMKPVRVDVFKKKIEESGLKKAIKILKKSKYDINFQDENGHTALMLEAQKGEKQVVQLLLRGGASIDLQNNRGDTALSFAVCRGDKEVVQLLLDARANIDHQETVQGWTALMIAAQNGDKELVQLLLDEGAKIDCQRTDNGCTAFVIAAQNGHKEVVQLLLGAGAKIDCQRTDNGYTALMIAAQNGHKEVVQLLLGAGAKIDCQRTDNGCTAFMIAAQNGHKEVVQLLLGAGANIDHQETVNGNTAFMCAASNGHKEVVQLLLDKDVKIDFLNFKGNTAFMFAASKGHEEVVRILLGEHCNIYFQDNEFGRSALFFAASNGHKEVVQLLLVANIDNQRIDNGYTPLMIATQNGHKEVVQLLLDAGANSDLQEIDNGWTALMIAGQNGHKEVLELLIENNADTTIQNKAGRTALWIAKEYGGKEIADFYVKQLLRKQNS